MLREVSIWSWVLARGKKVIGIRGEVLRKFGQFNSPGVVFFIKDGRVWREKWSQLCGQRTWQTIVCCQQDSSNSLTAFWVNNHLHKARRKHFLHTSVVELVSKADIIMKTRGLARIFSDVGTILQIALIFLH